jgi:hypothetical protein
VFKLNYRSSKPEVKRARKMETLGLIVIAILILALTITRSWHLIAWSAR